jgi:two-component system response regulator YesN
MINGVQLRRRKVRTRWRYVLSYLLIALIPILIFGTIYYQTVLSTIKSEVESERLSDLSRLLDKIDYTLGEFNAISLHFSNYINTDSVEIDFRTQTIIPSTITTLIDNYERNIALAVEMLVYLRGDANIYLSSGVYPYHVFESARHQDLTMSKLFSTVVSAQQNGSLALAPLSFIDSIDHSAAFYYPIPVLSPVPLSTVVFFLPLSTLKELEATYFGSEEGAALYLYNDQGTLILTDAGSDTLPSVAALRRMKSPAVFLLEEPDRRVAARVVSSSSGYSLIAAMDRQDFYARARSVQRIYIISVTSLILLGVLLSFLLARNLYRPVKQLLDRISDDEPGIEHRDDFDQIFHYWDTLDEQHSELMVTLNHIRPTLESSSVRRLLYAKGGITETLELDLKLAGIDLAQCSNTVFVVGTSVMGSHEELDSLIIAVSKEIGSEKLSLYATDLIDQPYVAIIHATSPQGGFDPLDTAYALITHFEPAIARHLHIGVGRPTIGFAGIAQSFAEASVAIEWGLFSRSKRILLFDEVASMMEGRTLEIPTIDHAMLIQGLKQASVQLSLQALDKMLTQVQQVADSFHLVQYFCFEITSLIVRTAKTLNSELDGEQLRVLCTFSTLAEYRESSTAVLTHLCTVIDERKQQGESALKRSILDYLHANYTDGQLSLVTTADAFSITPNFLSRFFKKETGYSYQQYVIMLRIDHVKERLISTDRPIKEIILEAGYTDIANFIRKFRSLEGCTPGQYREQYTP